MIKFAFVFSAMFTIIGGLVAAVAFVCVQVGPWGIVTAPLVIFVGAGFLYSLMEWADQ